MSKRYNIAYWSEAEGAVFLPWPTTHTAWVEDWYLDSKRKAGAAGQLQVDINGLLVHALVMYSGEAWDTVNGFRATGKNYYEQLSQAFAPNWNRDDCPACARPGLELLEPDFQCHYGFCPYKQKTDAVAQLAKTVPAPISPSQIISSTPMLPGVSRMIVYTAPHHWLKCTNCGRLSHEVSLFFDGSWYYQCENAHCAKQVHLHARKGHNAPCASCCAAHSVYWDPSTQIWRCSSCLWTPP